MKARKIMKVSAEFERAAKDISRNITIDTGRKCSLIAAADMMAREYRKNMRRGT